MVELKNVSFSYEGTDVSGVKDIDLTIEKGTCVLLCGQSGCGKSTLLRLINGLIPHYHEGEMQGEVFLFDKNIKNLELHEIAQKVGTVFQNPKSQFFNGDTRSELAFVCENLGWPTEKINKSVERVISEFAIEDLVDKSIKNLSGGQKQRLACAVVSTPNPDIYVLDEPSSNLDVEGVTILRNWIKQLKAAGKTVVVAEHRLYYLLELVDRVVILNNGKIQEDMSFSKFSALGADRLYNWGLRCPFLEKVKSKCDIENCKKRGSNLKLENFCYAYKGHKATLHINRLYLPKGKITALIGENGAGKSTFAKCLCGIYKNKGIVTDGENTEKWKKRLSSCYMVMQDVNHQLFAETVEDEVSLSMDDFNKNTVEKVLKDFNLQEVAQSHPVALSGGQKQRTAVAGAIVSKREIIVFDEPTSGLDYRHMKEVAKELEALSQKGKTILVVTHDAELILSCCHHLVHMEKGKILDNYDLYENEQKVLDFFKGLTNKELDQQSVV